MPDIRQDCLAWKPLIISSVLRDFPAVLYLDAGCIFQGSLDEVLSLLYCEGGSEPPVLSDGGVGGNATTASGDELERRQQHAGTHAAAGKCDGLMTIYAGPFMSLKDLTHPAMLRWFGVTDDIGQWTQVRLVAPNPAPADLRSPASPFPGCLPLPCPSLTRRTSRSRWPPGQSQSPALTVGT
mmetsp:Transcript_19512/g.54330  ORF Transcript_19512/g.54330 Transcript_19512/m.54330 type:complete len:182 (-) Transcript_19512:695-1240(-)